MTTKARERVCCPQCGSRRLWRDGVHYREDNNIVQRWLCRDCGYRFSESAVRDHNHSSGKNLQKTPPLYLKTANSLASNCRVSAWDFQAKNSAKSGKTTMKAFERHKGTEITETKLNHPAINVKGKIVEYSFWMLKQGYAESTIKGRTKLLKILAKRGADLYDSESVKETFNMPRVRVFATVREDVIKWVDKQVEKARFRNRSHAIEYALIRLMEREKEE